MTECRVETGGSPFSLASGETNKKTPDSDVASVSREQQAQKHAGRAIAMNTFAQLSGHGVVLLAGTAAYALVSRYLGPSSFGRYSLIFAYVNLVLGIFANWGLGWIAARDASQRTDRTEQILASASLLQTIASGVSYGVLVALSTILTGSRETAIIAIAGLVLLLMPIDVLATVLQIQLRLPRAAFARTVGAVLTLAVTGIAILLGTGFIGIVVATTLATFLRYLLLLLVLRPFLIWSRLRPTWMRTRLLIIEAWPLALATVFATAVEQLPIVLLGKLSSADQVGYFSSASKITIQLLVIPLMLSVSIYPVVSRLATEDRRALARLAGRIVRYMIIMAVPLSLLGVGLGRYIVLLLYGQQFLSATGPLMFLLAQTAVLYPSIIAGEMLIAMGRQRTNLIVVFIEAVVVLVGCMMLVPSLGSVGAALSLLVASIVGACLTLGILHFELEDHLSVRSKALGLASIAFLSALLATHRLLNISMVIAFSVSVVLYIIALAVMRGFDRQDLSLSALLS